MPGPHITIREAKPEDAAACATVHHTSWVETYSGLLPAAHWSSDTIERRIETWQRLLDRDAPVIVAESDGTVIGIALEGPGRRVGDHEPVRDRELYSLYVLATHHGTGAGQELLSAVLPPEVPAQLWVADQNPRARRFYERNGFLPDGARYVDESLGLTEVRHVR